MLRFDGTYSLSRRDDPGSRPAFACAWQVKIVDFTTTDPSRHHIRPVAVIAVRKSGGIFKSSCAETLGKRIVNDFDLDVDALLWIEAFPDMPDDLFVATFTPRYHESQVRYTITWRPILDNERSAVSPWC